MQLLTARQKALQFRGSQRQWISPLLHIALLESGLNVNRPVLVVQGKIALVDTVQVPECKRQLLHLDARSIAPRHAGAL